MYEFETNLRCVAFVGLLRDSYVGQNDLFKCSACSMVRIGILGFYPRSEYRLWPLINSNIHFVYQLCFVLKN